MFRKSNRKVVVPIVLLFTILMACAPESSQEQTAADAITPSSTAPEVSKSDTATLETTTSDTVTATPSAPISNTAEVTAAPSIESSDLVTQTQASEEVAASWLVYEEENRLFSIEYPQDWSVEPPFDLNTQTPVNVWQFRGEQTSPQFVENVTLGRYVTPTISMDTSLESWFKQVDSNEFEFERLRAEAIEIDGYEAYTIHDRITPPGRDSYTTYVRCQNRVWFLQALDVDLESMEIERTYNYMLDSLSLKCDE